MMPPRGARPQVAQPHHARQRLLPAGFDAAARSRQIPGSVEIGSDQSLARRVSLTAFQMRRQPPAWFVPEGFVGLQFPAIVAASFRPTTRAFWLRA